MSSTLASVSEQDNRARDSTPGRAPFGVLGDLRTICREIFAYRFLLQQLALRDIRVRYKQAVMGLVWSIFMPVMIVLAGLIVKFAMGQVSGSGMDLGSAGALAVKALPWAFVVGSIQFSTSSLVGNASLVTKIYFPREVLPLAAILAQSFDSAIGAVALVLVLPFMGVSLSWTLLWLPVLLLLLIVLTTAAALFLSCANLFFRDVKYMVQVVLMFGVFFTPVFFEPSMFGQTGAMVLMLNPFAPVLEGIRLAVVEGHHLMHTLHATTADASFIVWSPWHLVYTGTVGIVALVFSALLFHRSETVFAEYA